MSEDKADQGHEKSDHVFADDVHLFDKDEVDRVYGDHDSSGSEIEFIKAVTSCCPKEEHRSSEDDTYMTTSSEGSVVDEDEDVKNEVNPFKM